MKTEPVLIGPAIFKNVTGPLRTSVRPFQFEAVGFFAFRRKIEEIRFEALAHPRYRTSFVKRSR